MAPIALLHAPHAVRVEAAMKLDRLADELDSRVQEHLHSIMEVERLVQA